MSESTSTATQNDETDNGSTPAEVPVSTTGDHPEASESAPSPTQQSASEATPEATPVAAPEATAVDATPAAAPAATEAAPVAETEATSTAAPTPRPIPRPIPRPTPPAPTAAPTPAASSTPPPTPAAPAAAPTVTATPATATAAAPTTLDQGTPIPDPASGDGSHVAAAKDIATAPTTPSADADAAATTAGEAVTAPSDTSAAVTTETSASATDAEPTAVVAPESTGATFKETEFGRITEDGWGFVRIPDGDEVAVGQFAAGTAEEGWAFFTRKYEDLRGEADLQLGRLKAGKATPEIGTTLAGRLRAAIATPQFIGDLAALAGKAEALDSAAAERKATVSAEKNKAREEALAKREALVGEAESLGESTAWKATGDRYKTMLDEWKAIPRADRTKEQDLWKRFSTARSTFDKRRRQHFAQLDAERAEAKAVKETIVTEAEALSTSSDWGNTAAAYRDLMTRWKAAPRGARAEDDALWNRFRAAQDAFFNSRTQASSARDSEFGENLVAKEALVAEAEALLPITDADSAKSSLRSIHERWEKIGHVARADRDRIEGRLKKVEDAVRAQEDDKWRRSNPELRARAEQTVSQFRGSVEKLEKQRAEAEAKGDARKVAEADKALVTTRMLLEAAERGLQEYGG